MFFSVSETVEGSFVWCFFVDFVGGLFVCLFACLAARLSGRV